MHTVFVNLSGVMALVNCYSAKLSATLTATFSFVKLLAAALIIAVGLLQFNNGNYICVNKYLIVETGFQ